MIISWLSSCLRAASDIGVMMTQNDVFVESLRKAIAEVGLPEFDSYGMDAKKLGGDIAKRLEDVVAGRDELCLQRIAELVLYMGKSTVNLPLWARPASKASLFHVTIDYGLEWEQHKENSGMGLFPDSFVEKNFPIEKKKGKFRYLLGLREMYIDWSDVEAVRKRYPESARVEHLLAFAGKYPECQHLTEIVAAGSVHENLAPSIRAKSGGRDLVLSGSFHGSSRILVVHEEKPID